MERTDPSDPTNASGHDGANVLGDPEQMGDGGRIDQLLRDLLLGGHHGDVLALERHGGQTFLVDRFEGIFCIMN